MKKFLSLFLPKEKKRRHRLRDYYRGCKVKLGACLNLSHFATLDLFPLHMDIVTQLFNYLASLFSHGFWLL